MLQSYLAGFLYCVRDILQLFAEQEAEAGAVEAVLPALPSEDAMAGEMETESSGQATKMPAPDCSEGGDYENTAAEVLETVTEAQDLPG